MKRKEILKTYTVNVLSNDTVFIQNSHFSFSYMFADDVVKDELKGKYRYWGGLQCNFHEDSQEYKNLEKWLCEIAESLLKIKNS